MKRFVGLKRSLVLGWRRDPPKKETSEVGTGAGAEAKVSKQHSLEASSDAEAESPAWKAEEKTSVLGLVLAFPFGRGQLEE